MALTQELYIQLYIPQVEEKTKDEVKETNIIKTENQCQGFESLTNEPQLLYDMKKQANNIF